MFIHNIQGAYDGAAHAANNHYAPINTTVGPSVGRCVWLTGDVEWRILFFVHLKICVSSSLYTKTHKTKKNFNNKKFFSRNPGFFQPYKMDDYKGGPNENGGGDI